jgi:hypothetical protein
MRLDQPAGPIFRAGRERIIATADKAASWAITDVIPNKAPTPLEK